MKIFLVVLVLNGSGNGFWERKYEIETWDKCIESVQKSSTHIPSGGDAEQGYSLFCTVQQ